MYACRNNSGAFAHVCFVIFKTARTTEKRYNGHRMCVSLPSTSSVLNTFIVDKYVASYMLGMPEMCASARYYCHVYARIQ
jgi:hypothetical protein